MYDPSKMTVADRMHELRKNVDYSFHHRDNLLVLHKVGSGLITNTEFQLRKYNSKRLSFHHYDVNNFDCLDMEIFDGVREPVIMLYNVNEIENTDNLIKFLNNGIVTGQRILIHCVFLFASAKNGIVESILNKEVALRKPLGVFDGIGEVADA